MLIRQSDKVSAFDCGAFASAVAHVGERYGADMRLPDLRAEIAKCERHGMMHNACGARDLGLTAEMVCASTGRRGNGRRSGQADQGAPSGGRISR